MDSTYIKICLLNYYRFRRNMLCCTELFAGLNSISDVTAITQDKKLSYEIEIKISISDLKADFKKRKHKIINGHYMSFKEIYPYFSNYYYFCIPEEILEKAIEIINEYKNPYYGIMSITDKLTHGYNIKIIKRSKKQAGDNERLYEHLLRRTASELVTLYNKQLREKNEY